MAKWAEKPLWVGPQSSSTAAYDVNQFSQQSTNVAAMNVYDANQFSQQPALQYLNAPQITQPDPPPSVKLTYARNAEGGLSFYANGLPVGAIANRDLIRLIQQAAECLQVTP